MGLLAFVAVVVAAYLGGVVLPYYVNGLDALPLEEVASGAFDPKCLWPATAGLPGALARMVGLLAAWWAGIVLPFGAFVGVMLLHDPRSDFERRTAGLTVALALATLLFMLTPLGRALTTWMLD